VEEGEEEAMTRASVQLVRRGEQHPYVISVKTPGWRGCDHALDGTVKQTMPGDLNEICEILKKANVKYYSPTEPEKESVMVLGDDGETEFVFRNAGDLETAVMALVRAGWLSPALPVSASVN
jgi:hypothetical protein